MKNKKNMKKINLILWILFLSLSFQSAMGQKIERFEKFNHNSNLKKIAVEIEKIKSIDSLLQSYVDEKKTNAVVAFVAKGGHVVYKKAFGFKDVENHIPATTEDYDVLFSQTKAITTVAFMTLVDNGLVKIDDPVSNFFPEIPNVVVTKVNDDGTYETRPAQRPMTFIDLMSHSSGLNAGLVGKIRSLEGKKDGAPAGFGGPLPEKK